MQESMLQKWIDDGRLGGTDYVQVEGGEAWIVLSDLPERFPVPVRAARGGDPSAGEKQIVALMQEQQKHRHGVAALLSFLIPGAGQIYRGEVFKGLALFVVITILDAIIVFGTSSDLSNSHGNTQGLLCCLGFPLLLHLGCILDAAGLV
jgi:hypothetical protein